MPTARRLTFFAVLFLCCTAGRAASTEAVEFRAGAATSNITPPIGLDIIGSFTPAPSKNVHDELHARCLVLDDGKTRLALVICDLLGVHDLVSREARRLIEETTGIPPANVLISATHTHSASSAIGRDRFKYPPEMDDYQHFVAKRIADGVQRAVNVLRSAEFAYGSVDVPEHLNNRRWLMRPGTLPENPFGTSELVKMNPPGGSPNLVEPAGPIDPELSFLSLREPGGKPIAVYAAYGLHYVGGTTGASVSADYYGMFCEGLADRLDADRLDPPFVALLANGTSGDVNNNDFRNPRPRKPPYEQMRYVADDVAAKVQAAMKDLKYGRDVVLDARYREIPITWRKPTPEQSAWAKQTLSAVAAGEKLTPQQHEYAGRFTAMAEYPKTALIPLQVLRIGDVCLGTMPCEVFAETGIEFRRRAPFKPAFLVELANGYFGYLPTPRHFELGGYETWLGTNRLEPQASVKMMDALLEMAGEMKP